jgi:hypothetical protein
MSRLRNFHLPLPEKLYQQLRSEAKAIAQPATIVARQAIEAWLRQRQRAAAYDAISAYAKAMAGTGADLDPALEDASLECLAAESRRREPRRHRRQGQRRSRVSRRR